MHTKDNHPVNTSRRQILGVGIGLFAIPGLSVAQTLIEGASSSGSGSRSESAPLIQAAPVQQAVQEKAKAAVPMGWRQYLLSGERSILMRRNGPIRRISYCTKEGYLDRAGYEQSCMMLRDVRAGRMFAMDPKLLDVLCGIQRWMEYNGRDAVIDITSGFRTGKTNQSTEGSAKNSMHLYGKAADIVISGASSSLVGAMAKQFNEAGGTGIYPARGFVHVDTGAHRTWVS